MTKATTGKTQKRRLGCEQAIFRKWGNITFKEVTAICEKEARRLGRDDITFSPLTIQQYVGAQRRLSMKRLEILASLLGVTNYQELDEVFEAPSQRGVGKNWVGEHGSIAKDYEIDISNMYR